jgi:hypothetical protein
VYYGAQKRGEFSMKKLMISAAAVIAVAAFTVPASADHIGGAPIKKDGKCWKDTGGGRDSRYGTWIDCPKVAAGGASDCSLGQLAWEKQHTGQQFFDHCKK